ncbi:cation transporter [Natronocalculus amylovorans]|uniref:Cation transporter n=1 Tax=Natronocalculus amylovorans TaxID=2917812 RepID=A0AAE3FXW9_9EURY|nr:cation transporter [Natronocalculus amylovorans]MCL9817221.1 cation transporter [Natronocalculus amylovorans]NUE02750.1 heavy-metal-associated domain-containing protein [Halorubraceae archaeon YAN]
MVLKLAVSGMSCTGCEANVESSVSDITGVSTVDADHESGVVTVEGDSDKPAIEAAITEAGYKIE